MAKKTQCDRTLTIRLNKSLQRCADSLTKLGYQPSWLFLLPNNNEVEKLQIPEKGTKLLPSQIEMWFTISKQALSDLQKFIDKLDFEDYQRHMRELSEELSHWANKTQGPRADGK
jgi:hypothetical protein